ncbi:excinuclease ABC subunit UvrA [Streptomyces thermocoprophilus]
MSKATRSTPQASAQHIADSHDLIRVHGARENNLKDVDVEIPKRRLTVFTGVSGSGKSSLVFDTIAAESQRLINETYSAFVQGFMPSLARPEVDVLDGLTTAIIVDQQRMGSDPRSTVGTATDATAMLRILYSRLGEPHIGPPGAFSFNVATVSASGGLTVDRGADRTRTEKVTFSRTGGMCTRCEGRGTVTDIDLTQLYDDSKSLNEDPFTIPAYTGDGWVVRVIRESGFFDPDKPIRRYTKKERHDFLYREPVKVKINGVNLTYEGLIPKLQKTILSKDRESMQPHIRAFVDRAVTFATCPECDGTRLTALARSSRIEGISIADACAMEIRDLAEWVRGLREPSVAPLLTALGQTLDSFVEIGLGYLALDRPSGTLSGGEAQRVKMIRHLGSSLTDVTYVFDEPTIGLHPHDIQRMNDLLLRLRDKGNTVLVVEHKPEVIAIADHVVDLGPGAGTAGGTVCYEGTVDGLRTSGTVTGRHLDDRAKVKDTVREPTGAPADPRSDHPQPAQRRRGHPARGAGRRHRRRRLRQEFPGARLHPGRRRRHHHRPVARPRLAAQQPGDVHRAARPDPQGLRQGQRRQAALFSANSEGACPTCNGAGVIYTDLAMMAGVATTCEECAGKRFQASVLEYRLGGRDISEVLAMPVTEAEEFFASGEARTPCRAPHPRTDVGRRSRLSHPRAAHDHALRR